MNIELESSEACRMLRIKSKAFTLVELLVVIAIIAVLLAVLMPSLQKAQNQARWLVCRHNVKSLSTAWVVYADENNGKLIYAGTQIENTTKGGVTIRQTNPWCNKSTSTTREASKWGCENGGLYPYLKNVDVYRCPADMRFRTSASAADKTTGLWLTYVISDLMNGFYPSGGPNGDGNDEQRRSYIMANVRRPSEKLVFIEEGVKFPGFVGGVENVRSSYGPWVMNPTMPKYIDAIAMWHGTKKSGACSLGFADGHSDKIFLDATTTTIMTGDGVGTNVTHIPLNNNVTRMRASKTVLYMADAYSSRK